MADPDKAKKHTLINIPMANEFFSDFKFDLGMPEPSPGLKYLFYPFNHESYFKKPRLTNLNFLEKPQLFTRIDLNFPIDDLNIKPEVYNPDPAAGRHLTEEDEVLFGDKKHRRPSQLLQQQKGHSEKATPLQKSQPGPQALPARRPAQPAAKADSDKEEFDLYDPILRQEHIRDQLLRVVSKSFEASSVLKVTSHPYKKDVYAEETFKVLPNFNDIDKKYVTATYDASLPFTAGRSALMLGKGTDGTKHISEFVEAEGTMKEEGRLSLRHAKDFRYFFYEGETRQKDLVEKTKYVLMYDHKDRQAKFQRVTSDITLHRPKQTGPKKRDLEQEKLQLAGRKSYLSEADRKKKLLAKMGKRVEEKYAITEAVPDPAKPSQDFAPKPAAKKKPQNNPNIHLPPGGAYDYFDSGQDGDEEGEEEDGEEEDDEDFEEEEEDAGDSIEAEEGTDEASEERAPRPRPRPPRERLPRHSEPGPVERPPRPEDDDEENMVVRRVKPRRARIEEESQGAKSADERDSIDDFLN